MADPYNPWATTGGDAPGPVGPVGTAGGIDNAGGGTTMPIAKTNGGPAHQIGETYYDDLTGGWVTVQSNGQLLPYRAPTQTNDTSAQIGLNPATGKYEYFTIGAGGKPVFGGVAAPPMNATPGQTSTTSYSTSDLGPNAIANDAANRGVQQAQQAAAAQQAIATLNEQIRSHNQDYQNAQATLAFNQQKEAFAETTSNTQLQRQAAQDVFANTMSINTLNLQRATLVSNRDSLQAQLQMQAATQNAQNALAANQQNQQAEESRQANLLKTNEDVANFAGNPTDYGKLAAFQMANRGWGQAANASGGANLTSDESLQPLAGALSLRDTLQKPITPYIPQQVVAPTLGALDLSAIVNPQMPQAQMQSANAQAVPQQQPGQPAQTPGAPPASGAGGTGVWAAGLASGATAAPGYKDGGLASGAYISGEDGEELNIPLGAGQALVLNKKQLAKMKPADVKRLKAMADGGVFDGGNVLNLNSPLTGSSAPPPLATTNGLQDTQQAQNFLGDAYQKGLQGAGIGNVPTPVYASSPGFSPFVTQLYGGLGALAGRGPADWYAQQAQDLAPGGYRAIPYGVASRPVTRTA